MVFVDVRAVLLLALARYARTHYLAQAIQVIPFQAEAFLNLLTHVLGPRLGSESADAEAQLVFIDAHLVYRLR